MWGRKSPKAQPYRLEDHIDDAHVRAINAYVKQLMAERNRFVPFVSPRYGGTKARLLAVHKMPGALTDPANRGSGFLDFDNRDKAAKRHTKYLEDAKIAFDDVMSWNAIPWVGADFDDYDQRYQGAKALTRVIEELPDLSVIMLHGSEAKAMWNQTIKNAFPRVYERFNPIQTWSLGYELVNPENNSQAQIDKYERELAQAFSKAERLLRYAAPPMKRIDIEGDDTTDPGVTPPPKAPRPTARTSNPAWEDDWGRDWPLPPDER
ncbi:hypothetical protein [Gordonia sp. C13]|uniref:hypothetical protein n=1 Tax=Gordonia sp. C13 TaxID=2935078 RepID=UPI00200A1FD0|nr:hypothetical protein [Gordonia sp. C13]MCK8616127.1 hypothetical protein [Gordonia sp. C13]